MYIYEGLYVWCSTGVVCVHTYYYTYVVISINIHKYICSYMYAYTGIYICIFMKTCMYGAPQVRFVCIHTIAMNLHINTFMNMYIYS